MVNRYVMKSEHDLCIDCLPYEWRSGISDGLFLPIYPPRSMHISTSLWWLINFSNKYVSSLWLMLSPWIICTLTLPPLLASLVPRNFRRCIQPTIDLPQNSHHTYLLWHFHSHFEIYCHATSTVPFIITHTIMVILFSYAWGMHIQSYLCSSIEL